MQTSNQSYKKPFRGSRLFVALLCLGLPGFTYPALSAVVPPQTASKQVVASASGESIRFVSLGELIQMRLEVIASTGEILFDSGFRSTNVIDWPASDNKSQPLADGSYLCVVTVKDSTGKTARRQAIASLRDQSVSLKQSDSSLLTAAQVDAGGTVSTDDGGLTIVEGPSPATAVLAHDGTAAHLSTGVGGLSISSGDFFANKALEHIQITAEGNVGIGTSNPQSKLDVVGLIRASEGIIFPDGSIQFSASKKTFGAPSQRSSQSLHAQGEDAANAPDTSGTGTTGKISKWQDGPNGVLNDSNITEVAGAIGINGSPDTSYRLDVNGSTRIRGSNPGFNLKGLAANGNVWLFQTVDDDGRFRLFGQDNVNPGLERLTISLSTGNVGIGATVPTAKLDVAGNINTSTQYNIGGTRILSAPGQGNVFAGAGAGAGANNSGINNSFFGYLAGRFNTTGEINSFFGIGAGSNTTTGVGNSFFGAFAGDLNASGDSNSFFGSSVGHSNTTGTTNSFFGFVAGSSNTTGSNNTIIGASANVGSNNLNFATAIGAGAVASLSNSIYLGRADGSDAVRIPGATFIDGILGVHTLSSAGSTSICLNAADRISPCSSSLRYKTGVQSFSGGLDIVRRLRPITFNWKDGGMKDVGFAAEEVNAVEPLLTTTNDKGEIEGVKYGQLSTVLVNAVKEQQAQIARQQRTIEQQQQQNQAQQKRLRQQQQQLDALKKLVCLSHPHANACR